MCSITGYIAFDPIQANWGELESRVESALSVSAHRGPDHRGLSRLPNGVIGHNRLSITDLSPLGNQPMSDDTGAFHLVLNGEIFNYKALRIKLEQSGIQFRSHSDTEVLLQMLIKYGKEALQELEGFFAFAFYDTRNDYWLIARDRFGEKPLYYFSDDTSFRFSSELRSLMQLGIEKHIDVSSLSMLLQFSYIPAPNSILKQVFKLQPGECFEIGSGFEKPRRSLWYQPVYGERKFNGDEVIPEFKLLMKNAVERRLESDVPLGCFLSGGMDSSVVALIASNALPNLKTYSIGFPDRPFMDESKYAREVAKHLGTVHEVFELSSHTFGHEVESVLNSLDEPFADASAMALWLLCRETRKHISVALSGDGADELLGGYNKHEALLRSNASNSTNQVLPSVAMFLDVLPSGRNNAFSNRVRQIKRYANGLEKNLKARYVYWSSFTDDPLHEDVLPGVNIAEKASRINQFIQDIRKDDFNSILKADQLLVLQGDMLPKVDMMSMAHALEVRAPFLDFHVVEFINSLPAQRKIGLKERKILLRECYGSQLPESVFSRAKKGFEVPLEDMLRGPLKAMVYELLHPQRLRDQQIFRADLVEDILREFYLLRRSANTSLIYSMLVFQHWYDRHMIH